MSDDIPARAERVRRALQAFLSWLAKAAVEDVDGPATPLRLSTSPPPGTANGSAAIERLELPAPAIGDPNPRR